MLRLYHVPNSSSQRVVWLLEEAGEPFDLVVLGDRASRLADPDHVARHPLGRVPVLEDDGDHIFESGAICLYLADKFPASELLPPPGTKERGLVYQWSFFAYTEVQARVAQIRMAGSTEAAEAPAEALRQALGVVSAALAGREFLVGERISVADVLMGAVLGGVRRTGVAELPPEVERYLDALESRPAKQRSDARNPPATT